MKTVLFLYCLLLLVFVQNEVQSEVIGDDDSSPGVTARVQVKGLFIIPDTGL